MIVRHWRGWTKASDADAYERLLRETVLPQLRNLPGYQGGYVLRDDRSEESEFLVLNFFDSLDAVKGFAGPNYATAIFEPEAKELLARIEPFATHYDVRVATV
ncbi:MAG TPA: antibiotic biosynthesis monooxygenase [Terracidiphilus sp.]|jgi:heme-degrading monooxygenase HmoA|nr:antibiotic biosynthesis monooxygenase [Terracidiphilus sp.]